MVYRGSYFLEFRLFGDMGTALLVELGGGLPIKSDGGQNVKGTKFCQKLYHRVR